MVYEPSVVLGLRSMINWISRQIDWPVSALSYCRIGTVESSRNGSAAALSQQRRFAFFQSNRPLSGERRCKHVKIKLAARGSSNLGQRARVPRGFRRKRVQMCRYVFRCMGFHSAQGRCFLDELTILTLNTCGLVAVESGFARGVKWEACRAWLAALPRAHNEVIVGQRRDLLHAARGQAAERA